MNAVTRTKQGSAENRILIFDIDLTICDNAKRKQRAIERGIGVTLSEEEWQNIKTEFTFSKILKKLGRPVSESLIERILHHFFYDVDLFLTDRPYEGAAETLRFLRGKGYQIIYVTGRPLRQTAIDFLSRNEFPQGEVYAEKVLLGESHKKTRIFRDIAKNAAPTDLIVAIGDLPGDAQAAKDAGLLAIGTYQGRSSSRKDLEKLCDTVINTITELPDAIDRLFIE